ncbi:uncharacterized protein PGTG_06280 [Puccinia graminis f. sp. tritici CRL 75-36-700-3]|uniref:Uncharacterized protein n=1 Tax=Puccinia graminis f. sp. tritici (strain CRL 75-36-700-3 / race SCCL) TaxID=418459 RepID=E3K7M6_PUCGT|nr:uncharacterized protein PGTG_06280 [Puccinia graminis f. sp. tritici CRL 75-36-700-3]EFP80324.2 hypothetical protein PGTG_06280 [Puccinia graminis f. sp. tritici CRL 75-36-700-3]
MWPSTCGGVSLESKYATWSLRRPVGEPSKLSGYRAIDHRPGPVDEESDGPSMLNLLQPYCPCGLLSGGGAWGVKAVQHPPSRPMSLGHKAMTICLQCCWPFPRGQDNLALGRSFSLNY